MSSINSFTLKNSVFGTFPLDFFSPNSKANIFYKTLHISMPLGCNRSLRVLIWNVSRKETLYYPRSKRRKLITKQSFNPRSLFSNITVCEEIAG